MPPRPHKPCRKPGCGRLTQDPSGYCPVHVAWGEENSAKNLASMRKRADDRRENSTQRGYGAKWRSAREGFLRAHPLCIVCGRAATIVDHIIPHRGDMNIFWDRTNWAPMCKTHHDEKTARGE